MDAGLYDNVYAGLIDYACCDSTVVLWSFMPEIYFTPKDPEMVPMNQDKWMVARVSLQDDVVLYSVSLFRNIT